MARQVQRLVVALGGNALLRRGEVANIETQRSNARAAAEALAPLIDAYDLVITHGNGPQIGALALMQESQPSSRRQPLDVLGAESEGLIGYLLELELRRVQPKRDFVTLLTLVEVNSSDPQLKRPTKPIGPVYAEEEWRAVSREAGWNGVRDGAGYRRAVPSPHPIRILQQYAVETLLESGAVPICAGGGGVPVCQVPQEGLAGVEGVIDKDWTSARLALGLEANRLVMLTDVDAVYRDWGKPTATPLESVSLVDVAELDLPEGSIGPKVDAALWFAQHSTGSAAIGALAEAERVVRGTSGTRCR